jgi:hypothetical protein
LTAVNDSHTTPVDVNLEVTSPGVLANDSGGTAPLLVQIPEAAAGNDDTEVLPNGLLFWEGGAGANNARTGTGGFIFVPNGGFQGVVNHTYTVVDADGATATATLSITVGASVTTFDLTGDGSINLADMARIVSNLGLSAGATNTQGDVNADGKVNMQDVMLMRNRLNTAPPSPAAAVVSRVADARAIDQAVVRVTDLRARTNARAEARVRDVVRSELTQAPSQTGENGSSVANSLHARRSTARVRSIGAVDQVFGG